MVPGAGHPVVGSHRGIWLLPRGRGTNSQQSQNCQVTLLMWPFPSKLLCTNELSVRPAPRMKVSSKVEGGSTAFPQSFTP